MRDGGGVTFGCCLVCMWPSRVTVGGVSQKTLHVGPFSRDSCAVAQQYLFFLKKNLNLRICWINCRWLHFSYILVISMHRAAALPGSCLFTSNMVTTSFLHVMLQTGFMVGSAALNLQCKYRLFWSMKTCFHSTLMRNTPSLVMSCCFFHCSNKAGIKVGIYVVVECVLI